MLRTTKTEMDNQDIKNRFGIIGNSPLLNRAIDIARQVAPTDISDLIQEERGAGKQVFSHIIHQLCARKHGPFVACSQLVDNVGKTLLTRTTFPHYPPAERTQARPFYCGQLWSHS